MSNILVIPNEFRDENLEETKKVVSALRMYGATVFAEQRFRTKIIDANEYGQVDQMLKFADIAVVLGGDGTILRIAPQAAVCGIPILGINLGHLGFLAQMEKDCYSDLEKLVNGNYTVKSYMMLDAVVVKQGVEGERFLALNDIVASAGGKSRMISVSVAVNGTNVATYSADGLITATAVGSTAYSLSAGGAVLHPDLDAMIITPVCPHTLTARSTVVPGGDEIWVSPAKSHRSEVSLLVDGKTRGVLENDEFIKITKSKYRTRLIKLDGKDFFDVLRTKLSD